MSGASRGPFRFVMIAESVYDKFDTLVSDREQAMGAAQNTYSAFDPSADALPTSSYNAPADPEATTTKAQAAYSAPEQLKESVATQPSGYSVPDMGPAATEKTSAAAPAPAATHAATKSEPAEYKNAETAAAPSPYAVTSGGQTEAAQKFVMKQRRDKNWNEELQELVDSPDSAAKYHQLSALIREFNFVADTFGKIIISEMSYPANMRTVKPVSAGGQAGGEKYVHKNIFFKFAIDMHGIYGGDEHAMKAAEHDLKGLIWYSNSGVKQLHFPLMSLVDYLGYRLIALSVLPLASGGKSLLYGSCDGGQTVNTIDPTLNGLMEKAGDRMKLKKHRAGLEEATKKWISGPVDIEGHKGQDGRYYVLDYARTFPCEAFSRKDGNFVKGQHLYKLLRPELVRSNITALSSDAFSAWGIGDRESVMEVQLATARLFNDEIPRVGKLINDLKEDSLTAPELIALMHQNGINVRHMGRLRSYVPTNESFRRLMLIEMTLRVVKNEIRAMLRKAIFEHPLSEEPARRAITPILNRIMAASEDSAAYWAELKDRARLHTYAVQATYRFALNDQEAMHDLSILINFEDTEVRRSVINRLQQLAGFRLIDEVATSFCKQRKWRLLPIDIAGFVTQFRSSNLMDISEALSCLYEAQDLKGAEAYRMADAALFIFRRALSKMHHLGNVENLLVLAKLFFRCSKEGALSIDDCRKRAKETLDLAAELDPDQKHLYKLELGNILIQFNKYTEAKEYFEDVKKNQTDPALIALCDAAIVTALHLEGSTEAALTLCETLVGGNVTAAPKEWLWVLGVLRFTNATKNQDKFLQLYDAAPPLLAALQAGFTPPPDGHFQLQLGSALHNTSRKLGLLCLASCHPVLANFIFSNALMNFDGIFPLARSPLQDEHFTRLFLGSLAAPVKEIFASHCTGVSGAVLAKAVSTHALQLFAASRTTLALEDIKTICAAPCAPSLRELELDHLSIEAPILPHIVKSMTSLTALSLIGSPIDKESFHQLFTQRSTLRELCISGETKWYESPGSKQKREEAEATKQKEYADKKAEREKKIAEGTPADQLPELQAPKEEEPFRWLEPVVTPPEAFAATGLLILELPGFRNLKTADLLAVLRVCPSLERLDLCGSAGFSHLELFNKIPDTRVSCLIASSGFPYYWSDSPLRLELSRFGQAMAVANRTSPQVMVKHLNNQANLSIPGLVFTPSMNSAAVMYKELPFSRHRFDSSTHSMYVQNTGQSIIVRYTEAGPTSRDADQILHFHLSGPVNGLRALVIKGAGNINAEVKHMGNQPWPNSGMQLAGQEKYVRGIQNSLLELPRARRPVTLLMIIFLYIEELASTKQL